MPDTCSLLGIPRDSAKAVTGRSSRATDRRGCVHGDYQEEEALVCECCDVHEGFPQIDDKWLPLPGVSNWQCLF
jgi:hypothetical protein